MSQAVFGRAARREYAWPSGRLGRGGATIAQPPRRDALVLDEDDHLLPEGCGLLDRGGVHATPLQVEGDCPPPPPPLNFILSFTLPQPYLAASVRRLRGFENKMESRDSSVGRSAFCCWWSSTSGHAAASQKRKHCVLPERSGGGPARPHSTALAQFISMDRTPPPPPSQLLASLYSLP